MKPKNPFRKGSLVWSLMEGDWEDLTATQIADVLGTDTHTIWSAVSDIKRKTGYAVPYIRQKPWGKTK